MRTVERLGPLAAGTAMLVGAAFEIGNTFGAALLGAGLIVLGAWLAVEIRRAIHPGDDDGS